MFKPLLSATVKVNDLSKLQYPLLVSPKYDGIRCLVLNGVAVSRNLKPIRNLYCQKLFSHPEFSGFDGELIVGNPTDAQVFRNTSSGVMSEDGEPDVKFYVFDLVTEETKNLPYETRLHLLTQLIEAADLQRIVSVPSIQINNLKQLELLEDRTLELGYEGVMLRDAAATYKYGRSTFKEQILMKFKRMKDVNGSTIEIVRSEAVIIGYKERMQNNNPKVTNLLGHSERSSHKDNMVGRGDLGALIVHMVDENFPNGVEFTVGTGFNDEDRKDFWDNQTQYLGSLVAVEYTTLGGYDKPRFPSYKGVRDPADMGE